MGERVCECECECEFSLSGGGNDSLVAVEAIPRSRPLERSETERERVGAREGEEREDGDDPTDRPDSTVPHRKAHSIQCLQPSLSPFRERTRDDIKKETN